MNENNDNALLKGGGESLLKTHLRFNANNNSHNNSNVQKGEIYNASNGIDKRPADLVRRFGDLYSMARLDTLDALDNLNELDQFNLYPSSSNSSTSSIHSTSTEGNSRTKSTSEELKNKLLFSVVVVSDTLTQILQRVLFFVIVIIYSIINISEKYKVNVISSYKYNLFAVYNNSNICYWLAEIP